MTLITILNVLYVLVAIAMVALILMQRGAGAQAGSGFGAGASATVFGARGASSFLTRMTRWLAILFIGLSLAMGWVITHRSAAPATESLGVMGDLPEADAGAAPAASEVPPVAPAPAAGATEVPAPPPALAAPPAAASDVPEPAPPAGEASEKNDPPNQ